MKYRNNKLIVIIMVIAIGMVSLIGINLGISHAAMNSNQVGIKKILIDAGHGAMDGGASSKNGTLEKNINLSIAIRLKARLQKAGYEVIMTRDDDAGLYSNKGTIREKYREDLEKRCDLKESSKCDMFVSIHLNYFTESKYYGGQVWYSNYKNSSILASVIQKNFKLDLDPNNKRVPKAAKSSYKILRENDTMPGVIVECGFLSNYEEEQKLKSDEYQEKISVSISKSIGEFYKSNLQE